MRQVIMDSYSAMSKAKYEAEESLKILEIAKDAYRDTKVSECIQNILDAQNQDGKLTERDLNIFLRGLATDIKGIYSR